MTSTVTKDVGGGNNDYSTLSAWEAGQQGDITAGGNDTIQQAQVFSYNDTTAFVISGWTTDATHYIRIFAASGSGNAGFWDTTKFYISASDTDLISVSAAFVRFEDLQFQVTLTGGGAANGIIVNDLGQVGDVRIGDCIFKGVISGGSGQGRAVYGADVTNGQCKITIYNTVAFDFYDTDFPNSIVASGYRNGFSDMRMYNCDTYNCNTGFDVFSTSFKSTAVNCLGYNNAVNANYIDFSGSTFFQNSNNNASTDATAPGTSALTNQTSGNIAFKSTTSTNVDFLDINSGSTLVGAAQDNPLSGVYTDDIRGRARTSPWDIGANEFIAAGGLIWVPPQQFADNVMRQINMIKTDR